MLRKKDIETILKINGVSVSAPDEEIRLVLLNAHYNSPEVDAAIITLRGGGVNNQTRVEGLHKVLRSSQMPNPSKVSALLGADEVQVHHDMVKLAPQKQVPTSHISPAVFFLIGLALLGVVAFYVYQAGVFHSLVDYFNTK